MAEFYSAGSEIIPPLPWSVFAPPLTISEAGAIDAPDAADAMDAAMAWAATADAPPEDAGNAFDRTVDLEASSDPNAPPPPGEPLRVKHHARERQRVKND